MALKDQTVLGITFGQLISLLFLFAGIVGTYTDASIKISNLQIEVVELKTIRMEDRQRAETKRIEDVNSFNKMNDKLDLILIHNNMAEYAK